MLRRWRRPPCASPRSARARREQRSRQACPRSAATHSQASGASLDFAAVFDAGRAAACDVGARDRAARRGRSIARPRTAPRTGSAGGRDRSRGCAGRRKRRRGPPLRAASAPSARRRERGSKARANARARRASTPAQGSSGRQSSVDGSPVPRPSQTSAGRIEPIAGETTSGAASATAPTASPIHAGARNKSAASRLAGGDAMRECRTRSAPPAPATPSPRSPGRRARHDRETA